MKAVSSDRAPCMNLAEAYPLIPPDLFRLLFMLLLLLVGVWTCQMLPRLFALNPGRSL